MHGPPQKSRASFCNVPAFHPFDFHFDASQWPFIGMVVTSNSQDPHQLSSKMKPASCSARSFIGLGKSSLPSPSASASQTKVYSAVVCMYVSLTREVTWNRGDPAWGENSVWPSKRISALHIPFQQPRTSCYIWIGDYSVVTSKDYALPASVRRQLKRWTPDLGTWGSIPRHGENGVCPYIIVIPCLWFIDAISMDGTTHSSPNYYL
jgi:hypothetical protein